MERQVMKKKFWIIQIQSHTLNITVLEFEDLIKFLLPSSCVTLSLYGSYSRQLRIHSIFVFIVYRRLRSRYGRMSSPKKAPHGQLRTD